MRHTSVKLETPVEFINVTPINPLISKCQIKVCYVGDDPNRNGSIITKDVAKSMANSLPGSPIVGFFQDGKNDFDEHNKVIDISNGKFEIKDTTKPYGFVDLAAKVWFQKFLDDGETEHEYLMTEGYLWTGQYPECQRVIDKGNNQSMELDEKTLDATWTKDNNGKPQFFIINEAIISKLCILGEDIEPCFEGSSITKIQFSFEDNFKQQLFSMMNELKDILNKGGAKQVFTTYAVEIGDTLWSALYQYVDTTYPGPADSWCSIYRIEGVYEEGSQKFAILQNRTDLKYYRLDFEVSEKDGFVPSAGLTEVTKNYTPLAEPQFALNAIEDYETEFVKQKKEKQDKTEKPGQSKTKDNTEGNKTGESDDDMDDDTDNDDTDDDDDEDEKKKKKFNKEGEEVCEKCGHLITECVCGGGSGGGSGEKKKKKKDYNLDDIEEYTELSAKYDDLQTRYSALMTEKETLETKLAPLVAFKAKAEKASKEEMIKSFYMLSDDDKKDVIDNIDTYSLDDIEAKLSIICVRNKVSFDLDDNKDPKGHTTFNLDDDSGDETVPAWVKAVLTVAKSKN